MSNFITIKKLKELTNGIINIKPLYANISDNYSPTYRELREGKFFNRFVDNTNPAFVIVGLKINGDYSDCYCVNENDIELIYPQLDSIVIDPIEYIPPCGIITSLSATSKFNMISKNINNEKRNIGQKCGMINPYFQSSNDLFDIKSNILTVDINIYGKEISSVVSASYTYSGISKSDIVTITQKPNVIGNWIFDYEETNSINLTITPNTISNRGGQSKIRVMREFTKYWMKKDSCGKVWETSATTCHTDDVTSCCQYDNTNPEHFVRLSNIITTKKQEFNALEQSTIITANYKNFNSQCGMLQDKGGIVTYVYDLGFLETDNTKLNKLLETSLPTEIKIPLISNKNMLIDDVYHSSIIYENLTINTNDKWYKAEIDDSGEDVILIVKIIEPNHNRIKQRISTIDIYNDIDENKKLSLTIIQPQSNIKETIYELYLGGGGEFTTETIKGARITFKPSKKDIYEDGTWDVYDVIDNDIIITYDSQSTNPDILEGGILKRRNFNGLHDMKPKYNENILTEDVSLVVYGFVENIYGDVLAESTPVCIRLLGNSVATTKYELTFEDKNIYGELCWNYDNLQEKEAIVNSVKYTFINDIKVNTEVCETKLTPVDGWGKEFFTLLKDNTITCKPTNVNDSDEPNVNEYEVTQIESGKKINLILAQYPNIQTKEYNIIVKIYKNNIDENLWIEDGATLILHNEKEDTIKIQLSSGWLYPDEDTDVIYEGTITLFKDMNYDCTIKNIVTHNELCSITKYDNQYYSIQACEDDEIEFIVRL